MRQVIYTIYIVILFGVGLYAQQPAASSLYFFNSAAHNPAYNGLEESLSVTGIFRRQYLDITGSPSVQRLNAHLPVGILGGGVGLHIEQDALGARQLTTAMLGYAFHYGMGDATLSIGAAAGIRQLSLNGSELRTPDGLYDNILLEHNDALLSTGDVSGQHITASAGIYFKHPVFQLGLGIRDLNEGVTDLGPLQLAGQRTYFLQAGAQIPVLESLAFEPSVMLRSDAIETQVDISAIFRYNDNIFGGASFRGYNADSRAAVAIIFGIAVSEKITLAYAYDILLSDLQNVSSGTHEIGINYNLRKPLLGGQLPPVIFHPRTLE